MNVFYLRDYGRMGEGNRDRSCAIFKLEELAATLPKGTVLTDELLMDATQGVDPVEVFYAPSDEAARRNASIAVAEKYDGCEYTPATFARLWVCLQPTARKQGRKADIQDDLLGRNDHHLRTYTSNSDGYFDVAAVGTLDCVLSYIKAKQLKGFVVDVENAEDAARVEALGCEASLDDDEDFAALYQSLAEQVAS